MPLDRREFIRQTATGVLATASLPALRAPVREEPRYRAVAFDAFPIFDPRPVFALAETLFPGKGAALSNVWRARQFEYQWLRALGGQYADFLRTTEDALAFAAKQLQLDLTPTLARSSCMRTRISRRGPMSRRLFACCVTPASVSRFFRT